jgi:hypothetical protein
MLRTILIILLLGTTLVLAQTQAPANDTHCPSTINGVTISLRGEKLFPTETCLRLNAGLKHYLEIRVGQHIENFIESRRLYVPFNETHNVTCGVIFIDKNFTVERMPDMDSCHIFQAHAHLLAQEVAFEYMNEMSHYMGLEEVESGDKSDLCTLGAVGIKALGWNDRTCATAQAVYEGCRTKKTSHVACLSRALKAVDSDE